MYWIVVGVLFGVALTWAWLGDRKSGRRRPSGSAYDRFYSRSEDWFQAAKARLTQPRA